VSARDLVVVTPVRDEARYIDQTIGSMIAQTVRPALWIIVDDGSSDETLEIVARAVAQHPWIRLHRRPDRGSRMVGGGVIEAFNEGLSLVNLDEFGFLCKLDGDLKFGRTLFERLIRRFDEDERLGTASGKCFDWTGRAWVRLRTSDEFSMGACKFYRVRCFREIGGFVPAVMWDGIDCHRCRMLGWKARSFHDDELALFELRPMGSSHRNVLHGRLRWGRGQYFMGTHPLYAAAIAAYRLFERPYVVGGVCILAGFVGAWLCRAARYEDALFRRHLRNWQIARLLGRLRRNRNCTSATDDFADSEVPATALHPRPHAAPTTQRL
jgi:glycosyltransferase involved in cell wall biosynthesis